MRIEASAAPPPGGPGLKNLAEAAQEFEALLVAQMLKTARESGAGSGLGDSDGASASMMEMAEEYLAKEMARGSGFGLAKLIESQLRPQADNCKETGCPEVGISGPAEIADQPSSKTLSSRTASSNGASSCW